MAEASTDPADVHLTQVPSGTWPVWARWVVSAALFYHGAAVLSGALASDPSSELERQIADVFDGYNQTIDQGYTYRYYAPEPGPTPVITATIRYEDGRPEESLRIPEQGVWPRLRYQRQLALANHLFNDFQQARQMTGDGTKSAWARSFARHIAHTRGGCSTVTLSSRLHLIPDLGHVLQEHKGTPFDLDAEEYYTTPERIGEYTCDGL